MANTWESVVFLERTEATEAMKVLDKQGESGALEYLKQWHRPGEGTLMSTQGNPWRKHQHLYEEGSWFLFYDLTVPYIGLVYKVE